MDGTVLGKYAEAGEVAAVGRPLLKIADLDRIYLRAYFTSDQLAAVRLGQEVTVTADFGGDARYDYPGRVVWIASESEFTPKAIQTRDSPGQPGLCRENRRPKRRTAETRHVRRSETLRDECHRSMQPD